MANEQRTPLARTLPLFARQKALTEIVKRGLAPPGTVVSESGAIITVNLEVQGLTIPQITMPLFGPEYVRYPIQPGDKGVALPASFYIGGVSGLGTGTATRTQQGNLTNLIWFPIGNKLWSTVDPNSVTIYGPNGVVLRDTDSNSVETLTPANVEFDTASVNTSQNLSAGTGWSGVFTTPTGQTVTVQNGIIVNVA